MEQSSVIISFLNKRIPTQSSTHPRGSCVKCWRARCEAVSTWPQFMHLQENHGWRWKTWTQVISVTKEFCFKSTIIEKGRVGHDLTITTGNVVVLLFWLSSSETLFFALTIQEFHQVKLSTILMKWIVIRCTQKESQPCQEDDAKGRNRFF